ncbi:MAG: hypothetical protein EBZ96_04490, partial [Synechococcaceae bacterium WB9_3_282]|nr:hypothetical protein [Synechococcaceae bacterium WB9_3_282]
MALVRLGGIEPLGIHRQGQSSAPNRTRWIPPLMLILAASTGKNLELARSIESEAINQAMGCKVLDLCALNLPLFQPALKEQGPGESFKELEQAMGQHHGLFVCAPEYNGSIPPSLTNA